eukprot:1894959-Rhodomonas_salina.2
MVYCYASRTTFAITGTIYASGGTIRTKVVPSPEENDANRAPDEDDDHEDAEELQQLPPHLRKCLREDRHLKKTKRKRTRLSAHFLLKMSSKVIDFAVKPVAVSTRTSA